MSRQFQLHKEHLHLIPTKHKRTNISESVQGSSHFSSHFSYYDAVSQAWCSIAMYMLTYKKSEKKKITKIETIITPRAGAQPQPILTPVARTLTPSLLAQTHRRNRKSPTQLTTREKESGKEEKRSWLSSCHRHSALDVVAIVTIALTLARSRREEEISRGSKPLPPP